MFEQPIIGFQCPRCKDRVLTPPLSTQTVLLLKSAFSNAANLNFPSPPPSLPAVDVAAELVDGSPGAEQMVHARGALEAAEDSRSDSSADPEDVSR